MTSFRFLKTSLNGIVKVCLHLVDADVIANLGVDSRGVASSINKGTSNKNRLVPVAVK